MYIFAVHLQNRLQNETSKRQQAEEWCSMLEKELTAHLGARQIAETKCEKLNQRIRQLARKLKLQERILRKRQKESRQNRDHEHNQEVIHEQCIQHAKNGFGHGSEVTTGQEDENNMQEDICDEYTNSYRSYAEDDEPHFASDVDEEKIVEPQELQVIISPILSINFSWDLRKFQQYSGNPQH